jgi:hypothetical protein
MRLTLATVLMPFALIGCVSFSSSGPTPPAKKSSLCRPHRRPDRRGCIDSSPLRRLDGCRLSTIARRSHRDSIGRRASGRYSVTEGAMTYSFDFVAQGDWGLPPQTG